MDQFAWLKGGWDFEQLMLIGTLAAIIFGIFMVVYSTLKFFWNCIAWAARAILRWIISYRQRSEMKKKLKRRAEWIETLSDALTDGIDKLLDEGKITKAEAQQFYKIAGHNMGLYDMMPRRIFFERRHNIDVMEEIIQRLLNSHIPLPLPDATPVKMNGEVPLSHLKPEILIRLRNRGFNIPENLLPKETKAEVKSDDFDLEKELRTLYA